MINKLGTVLNVLGAFGVGWYTSGLDVERVKSVTSIDAILPLAQNELFLIGSVVMLAVGLTLRVRDLMDVRDSKKLHNSVITAKTKQLQETKERLEDVNILLEDAVRPYIEDMLKEAVAKEVNKQLSSTEFKPPVDFHVEKED